MATCGLLLLGDNLVRFSVLSAIAGYPQATCPLAWPAYSRKSLTLAKGSWYVVGTHLLLVFALLTCGNRGCLAGARARTHTHTHPKQAADSVYPWFPKSRTHL